MYVLKNFQYYIIQLNLYNYFFFFGLIPENRFQKIPKNFRYISKIEIESINIYKIRF